MKTLTAILALCTLAVLSTPATPTALPMATPVPCKGLEACEAELAALKLELATLKRQHAPVPPTKLAPPPPKVAVSAAPCAAGEGGRPVLRPIRRLFGR